jgi:hypothetical protein
VQAPLPGQSGTPSQTRSFPRKVSLSGHKKPSWGNQIYAIQTRPDYMYLVGRVYTIPVPLYSSLKLCGVDREAIPDLEPSVENDGAQRC